MKEREFVKKAKQLRTAAMVLCKSLNLGDDDAEDIAQETMIRLWQMHDSLDASKSQDTLARTIAYRLTIDHRRRTPMIPIDHVNAVIDMSINEGKELERQEEIDRLMAKMKALPSTQSTLLRMRHMEMKTTREIASILGIKETSVVTLLGRARRNLTNMIKKGEI